MSISGVTGMPAAIPVTKRQEMVAIIAARPAVAQQQQVALQQPAAVQTGDNGTSGQGTPAIEASGVDLYA
jgi:hypothetical protein